MATLNPLRALARVTPAPLDGLAELGAAAVDDLYAAARVIDRGLPGDSLDEWDPEHIRRTLPLNRAFVRTYFRSEVQGLENIPDGPSLLVGNHSGGTLIADTFAFAYEFYDHFGPDRRFHQLAHDVAARMPGFGMLRRYGVLAASHENAKKAFAKGAPVLVYPGGDWETFRPSWHSDRIEFGGRKGFIKLALEEGVPIVPVVAIGGQETALFVTRGRRLAKLTGLDRFARIKVLPIAIAPPFGISVLDLPTRLPLPAKIKVEVREPIDLRERFGPAADVEAIYDEVTGEMQESLDALSEERTVPVVG
ncbi:MAG TPA: lysophospholipid acyltransferase family protein [Thermoleophilaceae bacterium]|jgi:1-acyl-sn-glycerol-3-phosphate acyltransferase